MKNLKTENKFIALSCGTTVTMRPPKARDLFDLDHRMHMAAENAIVLICRLTGLERDDLGELSARDFLALQNSLNDFLTP